MKKVTLALALSSILASCGAPGVYNSTFNEDYTYHASWEPAHDPFARFTDRDNLKLSKKQEALLDALIQIESSGKDDAIGDGGKAIGCLQIWKPYWQDATERSGIGGVYKDCFKRDYARRIAGAYFTRYAKEAWTTLGKFDAETCARIHNAGPRAMSKKRKPLTDKYWAKVKKELKTTTG